MIGIGILRGITRIPKPPGPKPPMTKMGGKQPTYTTGHVKIFTLTFKSIWAKYDNLSRGHLQNGGLVRESHIGVTSPNNGWFGRTVRESHQNSLNSGLGLGMIRPIWPDQCLDLFLVFFVVPWCAVLALKQVTILGICLGIFGCFVFLSKHFLSIVGNRGLSGVCSGGVL